MRSLLSLRREIATLEQALKDVRAREDALETSVAGALVDEGVQNLNLDGSTVYLSTAFHCTKRGEMTAQDAVAAVLDLGLDDLCETIVQPQRIKSWALERLKEARQENPAAAAQDALPKVFLDTFHVHERVCIGSRKSNNAGAAKT